MKRVLLIGPDWEITVRFRTELVRDMRAIGLDVLVAAGPAGSEARPALERLGARAETVPFSRHGLNPLAEAAALRALIALMRRERPDAVLAFTVKPATFGLIAARLAGVPRRVALITGAGYALMDGHEVRRRLMRAAVLALYRRALAGAHAVIFQNGDDEALFQRLRLLPRHAAVHRVAGSGVDLARFSPEPRQEGPPCFLLIARLLWEKGLGEFVAAARAVKATHPAARFVVVGPYDGNPAAVGPAQMEAWVREGVIAYEGAQPDVRPFLRTASVFVLPSYREGMPRTVLEALASGRPVLTVDSVGCKDSIVDGAQGRIVRARDAGALAEGMRWFLDHPERWDAMSASARRRAVEMFDVAAVNRTIVGVLLGRSELPPSRAPGVGPGVDH